MKRYVLLMDFGSTYTKGNIVDLQEASVIASSKVETSVQTTLLHTYQTVQKNLLSKAQLDASAIDDTLICSSAFGGFKMVAIGLTESLTTEAAKRAALSAGTRILKTFAYQFGTEELAQIQTIKPDVILLTGGTNGGNTSFIIESAKVLCKLGINIPIIIAGNQSATAEVEQLFNQTTLDYYFAENVMPKVNVLNAESTREILREIFFKKIIYAKGFNDVAKLTDHPIIPTPAAVLNCAELLAKGTDNENGWGDLAIVDIGGATTDIHSVSRSISGIQDVIYEGLEEPFAKRTVEGDLGMRYSALSLYETSGAKYFEQYSDKDISKKEIEERCRKRENHPDFISKTTDDITFDRTLAKIATDISMERHVGSLRILEKSSGNTYYQTGKDLRHLKTLIGTGGIIVHNEQPEAILSAALNHHKKRCLKPISPTLYVDKAYLLSTLGLLGEYYPHIALKMAKQELKPI